MISGEMGLDCTVSRTQGKLAEPEPSLSKDSSGHVQCIGKCWHSSGETENSNRHMIHPPITPLRSLIKETELCA